MPAGTVFPPNAPWSVMEDMMIRLSRRSSISLAMDHLLIQFFVVLLRRSYIICAIARKDRNARLNGAIKDEDHDELAVWLDDDPRLRLAARD
jgi:hypothetical protein